MTIHHNPRSERVLARRAFWLQIALVLLLSAAALTPYLRSDVPYTDDGGNYRWRLVELARMWRQGVLFSRWQPDMVFGYGYPVFGFNFPLSVYPGALLHLLGLDVQWSWNLTCALYVLGCGLTMFLLARELFDGWPVWVAVGGYVYAPYLFTDTLYRGNPGEALALVLFPLILRGIYLTVTRARRRDVVLTALFCLLLLLAHSAATLFFTPFAVAWAVVTWLVHGRTPRTAGRLILTGALALGLAAFYLVPGLIEQDTIQIKRVVIGDLDFHNHFLHVDELVQWPAPADPLLANYLPPRGQGVGQVGLTLLALLALPWLERRLRWAAAFFGGALLAVNFLLLGASAFVWEHLPLVNYIIYPWRMVGMTGLWGALAAACAVSLLRGRRRALALAAALAAQLLFFANVLPWLYPNRIPYPGNYSPAHIMRFEAGSGVLGGTAIGEYLPIWVKRLPEPEPMIAQYDAGGPETSSVRRLLPEDLPPGVRIEQERYGMLDADLVLDAASPVTLTYRSFYFPGWNAYVDGRRVPTSPSYPQGLLQFPFPAGRHSLRVAFGTTPPRVAGTAISAVTAVICLGLLLGGQARLTAGTRQTPAAAPAGLSAISRSLLVTEALLAVALLCAKLAVFDRYPTWARATRMGAAGVPGTNWQPNADFGGALTLRSAEIPAQVASGGLLSVHLYPQVPAPVGADYRLSARLVDAQGLLWSAKEPVRPSGTRYRPPSPTFEWPAGGYADVWIGVEVLPGTPPGDYWLRVGAFDYPSLVELPLLGTGQAASRTTVDLGPIRVTPAEAQPDPSTFWIQFPRSVEPVPGLALWGANVDRSEAQPGDPLLVALFWNALETQPQDWRVRLELAGDAGRWVLGDALPLGSPAYRPVRWEPSAVVRDQHLLLLPAELESGTYDLQLTLLDAAGSPQAEPVTLSALEIHAPEKVTALPAGLQHALDVRLGEEGAITLRGYDLKLSSARPGGNLDLTLYWQAAAATTANYKVFVHLVDPQGVVRGQVDAVPVGWSRPTTGWRPGEVIVDRYHVPVAAGAPPGEYRLLIGMYPEGGTRLPVFDAGGPLGDALVLEGIPVAP